MNRKKNPTRRFDATEQTIYRDLRTTVIKVQGTSLRVDYDLLGGDPGVRIFFDRNGIWCSAARNVIFQASI